MPGSIPGTEKRLSLPSWTIHSSKKIIFFEDDKINSYICDKCVKKKSRQVLRKHVKGEPLLALCGGMKNRDNIPEQVAFVEK